MTAKRACQATTKAGNPCRATPRGDTGYCNSHSPREVQESSGFGGPQPGSGRPKLPKPHEELRKRVEESLERWLKPYEDALRADKAIVVQTDGGLETEIKLVADHNTRMKAAHDVLDRVYGKAAQSVEVTGSDTKPPVEIVAIDAHKAADAAHDFLRRLADQPPKPS